MNAIKNIWLEWEIIKHLQGFFKVQKKIMYTFEHVNKVKQKINK